MVEVGLNGHKTNVVKVLNKLELSGAMLSHSWPQVIKGFDFVTCLTGLERTLHII